jgi:hypothetical protein
MLPAVQEFGIRVKKPVQRAAANQARNQWHKAQKSEGRLRPHERPRKQRTADQNANRAI